MFRVQREVQPSGTVVALCTLDDPERRNILSPEMLEEIVPALSALAHDELLGALVVTGTPPAFCAGAPLGKLAETQAGDRNDSHAASVLRAIYAGFEGFAALPVPTIAAVNGAAVGAGMNLALACDLCVAGRSARFDPRFLQLGLHPGGAHTWSLTRLVGTQTARALVLFGEVLDGRQAAERGLVWRCVDDDELVDTALELARRAAAVPPALARRTKVTLDAVPGLATRQAATDVELEQQLWSVRQSAFRDRIAAAARPRTDRR